MPDAYDAVKINTTFIAPIEEYDQFGTPLIIGTANGVSSASITYFKSLSDLLLVYDMSNYPSIAKCATAMANNGVRDIAVGVYKTSIAELYEQIAAEARIHAITSVTVAGLRLDNTTKAVIKPAGKQNLAEFCEANELILVLVCTPPSSTNDVVVQDTDEETEDIVALRTEFASPNVYMVAFNDPAATDDIGGCVLGVMETTEPQVTMMWKPIVSNISKYFQNKDVVTLEDNHINAILQDYGLSESFTTAKIGVGTTTEDNIIQDISITRSIYAIKKEIQDAIIDLRKNTVKLGYTNTSLNLVSAAITTVLENNKTSALNTNGMIDSYNVSMPLLTDITPWMKSQNILTNVTIEIVLVGEIHRFVFELVVSLGGQ